MRMVYEHASEHPSEWAAITSIASKIGCSARTFSTWIRRLADEILPGESDRIQS